MVGDAPRDLVYVPGWLSHVELAWEEPTLAAFLRRLASFSRLILFDKRGTGLSDRVPNDQLPTLEERMDDVRAVMDAVGSERAAVFGFSEGGNMSALFAATYPERTTALITFGTFAKRVWSADYPWAPKPEEREETYRLMESEWGSEMDVAHYAPSKLDDPAFAERPATYLRRSASPGAAVALLRMNSQIDIGHLLPAIRVPTLVLHRTGDRDAHVEEGRWIASQIPEARFVELSGEDHLPWVGDQEAVLDEIEEFLTGERRTFEPDRVLSTVLFTDIVGSTERAASMSDRVWLDLLGQITRSCGSSWLAFVATKLRPPATDSSQLSMDRPVRCVAPARFAMGCRRWVWRFGPDCTRERSNSRRGTLGASRCTLPRASVRRPGLTK